MSSVSSVGTTSVDLFQLLQQAAGQPQAAPTPDTPADTENQTGQAVSGSSGGHHHHHSHLRGQIENAVTQALQSSDSSTDPNQVVQNAIASVLSANQPGGNQATGNPDASGQVAPSGSTPAANQSAFEQLLQAHGIDPQQFQKDFQTAVKDAQSSNGNLDSSQLFKSFPPGSNVDTIA